MPEEYISRTEMLADFEACNAANPHWTPQRVKTLLLRQPAADVAPVVHGKWQRYDEIEIRNCFGWTVTHWMPLPGAPEGGKT